MKNIILFLTLCLMLTPLKAQKSGEAVERVVYGFSIAAPKPAGLERFLQFVKADLAPAGINTLLLRVDYNYEYKSHPELRNKVALSEADVKQLVKTCQTLGIELVPQINLLGHQSWASTLENLLKVYPQFDETPGVDLPAEYKWPNDDGLYCKSYCPLHPEVHAVVFDLVDEIMTVFEAKAFHAGMDEVFYIADDKCPRCSGRDKAELFAGEVTKIRNHLAKEGRTLWIWGDRLLDGSTTGLGMWEASMNNTHRAIDLIPKDVVICDWHYDRAEPTAAYFAMKGFQVITCPWNKSNVAIEQYQQMNAYKESVNPTLGQRYLGMMQTIWTSSDNFLDLYDGKKEGDEKQMGQVQTFKELKRLIRE